METNFIPTKLKIDIINMLSQAGLTKIEATSFVHPEVIPQMGDAEMVMRGIDRKPGVSYTALVPNGKGAKRAIQAKVSGVRVVVCATETYNRRNVGMSIAGSVAECAAIKQIAKENNVSAEAVIGLAFGCPLEGQVPEERVLELAGHIAKSGYTEISIADSVGLANPAQVKRMMRKLCTELPEVHFSLHFHDTRGLGLANVLAGIEESVDTFDASIGGLGGCPVVAGATGNIATEDLVNMLEEIGIHTGIDVERLTSASRVLEQFLGRTLPSRVLKAGTRAELYRHISETRADVA